MLAQRIISPAELSERSGRSSQSVVVKLKRFNIPRIAFGWDRRVISKMQQFAEILLRFPRARFRRFPEKDSGPFFAQIGRATSEHQSLMRISYAVFCLKKKK